MNPETLAQLQDQVASRSESGRVPIDMIDADQLPRETALKYEELCLLVGSLYINSHHDISTLKEQFTAVRLQLEKKIRELAQENKMLREQLNGQSANTSKPA